MESRDKEQEIASMHVRQMGFIFDLLRSKKPSPKKEEDKDKED